jgi:hypothetical protein
MWHDINTDDYRKHPKYTYEQEREARCVTVGGSGPSYEANVSDCVHFERGDTPQQIQQRQDEAQAKIELDREVTQLNGALPRFDVDTLCRRRPTPTFDACRNDEQAAYNRVKIVWPTLSQEVRTNCGYFAIRAGRWYQNLEHCVDIALNKAAAQDYRTHSAPFQP